MNIVTEAPLWFSICCLALGAFFAWLLYFGKRLTMPRYAHIVAFTLRFLLGSITAFLLLSPLLRQWIRTIEKPIIIIAQDNSESLVMHKDSATMRADYLVAMQQFVQKLQNHYDVQQYTFGEETSLQKNIDFSDKITDISGVLKELSTKYANRNTGALILASDGIYNRGENPLYTRLSFSAPLYTIALGDTSLRRDLVLKKVVHNHFAYLGNKFPMQIDAEATRCAGESMRIRISRGAEILYSEDVSVSGETFFYSKTIFLQADKKGVHRYQISIEPVAEELSLKNNTREAQVEILDNRQKVLLLAHAPHPDIQALKSAIEQSQQMLCEVFYPDDVLPAISSYQVAILHQLPSARAGIEHPAVKKVLASGIACWFIGAENTNWQQFSGLQYGLQVSPSGSKPNTVTPVVNETFQLFTFSAEYKKIAERFPPLTVPFASFKSTSSPYVFMKQKIGIVTTENPLWVFYMQQDRKVAILAGEGLWRWKLHNFKESGNHACFNDMVQKTVQFLSLSVDRSRFKVIARDTYLENEAVQVDAELYNESFELINEDEVQLLIQDSAGKKYPFVFTKTNQAYYLNAGILPVGDYTYKAMVKHGDKTETASGRFSVQAIALEALDLTARHNLLYSLSEQHGGEMFYPSDFDALYNAITQRSDLVSLSFSEQKLSDFIELKWLFFCLLAFAALEWFLRKYYGGY